MSPVPAIALSIAGSDPSGGAGIQADLKVACDLGVFGCAAVTALTVQGPRGVRALHAVAPEVVHDQIAAVLEELPVAAIKIGMLGTAGVARAAARALRRRAAGVPVVLDPVLRSSGGRVLLDPEGLEVLLAELLPEVALLTPNLPERAALDAAAGDLLARCRDRGIAVLLKGGHGEGTLLRDTLFLPGGGERCFAHPRIATSCAHGTGCALSAAVAARLALGDGLADAVAAAVAYVQERLAAGAGWLEVDGHGPMPLGLRGQRGL